MTAATVLLSVVLHGVSAEPVARWFARHPQPEERVPPQDPGRSPGTSSSPVQRRGDACHCDRNERDDGVRGDHPGHLTGQNTVTSVVPSILRITIHPRRPSTWDH